MRLSPSSRPAAAVAAVSVAAALAAAVPPASGQDPVYKRYTPSCAPPGGIVNVAHDFSSIPNKAYETGGTVLWPEVWKGLDGVVETDYAKRFEPARVAFGYREDPFIRGSWIPEFRQPLAMPAPEEFEGLPIVDYQTFIQPYGKDGTEYTNDAHSTIYPDFGPRLYLADKKVKAIRHARTFYMVRGFRKSTTYAHVISSRGKVFRHQRLRPASGDDTCGRTFGELKLHGIKPGTFKVVVNKSRTSKSAAGGASRTIRVTR